MHAGRLRTRSFAAVLAALSFAAIPATTLAEPSLAAAFADPPFVVAARCDPTQPLAYVNLGVVNRGDSPTPATLVTAVDATGVLGGQTTLPPIAPGARNALRVGLRRAPSNDASVGGTHAVTITIGAVRLAPIAVTLPATFCAAASPPADTVVPVGDAAARVRSHRPLAAPGTLTSVYERRPNTAQILREQQTPAAPVHLHVSNGQQECAAHVGLLGALACPDMVRSGNVLLVWDWRPAAVGPAAIDGFRVYRVNGGVKQLVFTRREQNNVTLYDVPGPSGNAIGTCYAVSAFAGAYESTPGAAACLTRQNTLVLASPSIVPTPTPTPFPRHVVIHVTDDSYPLDTVVAAGGDITWINDDTDEHSVYGIGGSIVGDLPPNGGRFTYTFRDIDGMDYVTSYTCEYHQNMYGRITIRVRR